MRAPLFLFLFSFFLLLGAPRPSAADTVPALTTVDKEGNLVFEIKGNASLKISPQDGACDADAAGAIRFNTATETFEGCNGKGTWKKLGGDSATPVGTVIWYAKANCPEGYLPADGRSLVNTTYTDLAAVLGTTFGAGINVPNLLGEFVRGFDTGRGVDVGRLFGSFQSDAFQGHGHNLYSYNLLGMNGGGETLNIGAGYPSNYFGSNNAVRGYTADSSNGTGVPRISLETRPRNVALMPCIKY